MRVADIFTPEPVTGTRDHTVKEAAEIMREQHVGDLIIVEHRSADVQIPVGILTDRDIVVGILAKDTEHVDKLLVGDVMTDDLEVVQQEELVSDALKRMRAHGVRRMPVVDGDGVLLGILTMDDIIDCVTEMLEDVVVLMGRGATREELRRSD